MHLPSIPVYPISPCMRSPIGYRPKPIPFPNITPCQGQPRIRSHSIPLWVRVVTTPPPPLLPLTPITFSYTPITKSYTPKYFYPGWLGAKLIPARFGIHGTSQYTPPTCYTLYTPITPLPGYTTPVCPYRWHACICSLNGCNNIKNNFLLYLIRITNNPRLYPPPVAAIIRKVFHENFIFTEFYPEFHCIFK